MSKNKIMALSLVVFLIAIVVYIIFSATGVKEIEYKGDNQATGAGINISLVSLWTAILSFATTVLTFVLKIIEIFTRKKVRQG